MVNLENCQPELSYILDCWKVSSVDPVSLLSVDSKVFEKLVNNKIVESLDKYGLFSGFHYGFRSSQSIADLDCFVL